MGLLSSIFGSKPTVPAWNDINLSDQQTKAISANQGSLGSIENLATGVNTFNQDQLTQLMNNIMPGWSKSASTASSNISDELSGKIPSDVSGNIQSSAAAQALTGGFGGSGLAGNLTAKDLGLTSLDLTNQGLSSLESWTSMIDKMFAPGQFNISSMFVTPQQEFQDTFENQQMSWGAQWMQNQVSAMPDPVLSGINAEIMSLAKSFVGGMGGKMGGGGAGAGAGGGGGGGGGSDPNNYSESGSFSDLNLGFA
jgi:hypothetical protein